jgi:regulator of protease activity HflC (stomatin/prohibitin superfamily)
MLQRMRELAASIAKLFARGPSVAAGTSEPATPGTPVFAPLLALATSRRTVATLVAVGALGATGYFFYQHPPMKSVGRGEIGLRVNQLTGTVDQFHEGSVLVLPGLHQMRVYSLRDQAYRPEGISRADGASPVQSIEGLSLGVDLTIRYSLDPAKIGAVYKNLPDNVGAEIVEPAVQGIVYKVFARYTVREIFSTKRGEIQKAIETELAAQLARDGVALHGVQMGKVDLPADYRRGMESLLAEELASEKMRFTLELKDKQVKETELVAEADKVRREKAAEAAGQEQIIAAKAQEEAMKHVLPFKQKQIEQRSLEAEAEKGARIKGAEGNAQARRIEATGEADARQKLADAEAYRQERLGKVTAAQMAVEGALVTKHPLLIQKTLADKLSDKIQVIIAPPPADGGFIGATLLGGQRRDAVKTADASEPAPEQPAAADTPATKEGQ